ncbi:hypothetical protein OH76DRAFT_1164111 [Lentinus brumalis]|uniref:Uncharacterized protein n=1 Tax=Lentinus brumalis TaxID=2498619 RepID=A0A371DMY6_9APHY|nr:hypothetical protein OH76DRAFT_1164111 [Polyporus brumalis]
MFSDYAPSVASRDPPPRYQEVYTAHTPPVSTPAGPSIASRYVAPLPWPISDERSPLLSKHEPKRRRVLRLLCAVLGFILLVIFILQNLSLISCPLDDVSASDKRAIRRQWKAQMKDHDLLVKQWAADREQHTLEMHQWEDERAQWREERNKWEEERKSEERHRKEVERMRQGSYWTDPIGDAHCGYSTRVYRATLKDIPPDLNWLEVCSDMPNTIHDRPVDRPDFCQPNDQGEMQASWLVNWDEPVCVPYWDKLQYKRCAPGKPGIAHFEARLWGMNHGENWETMCATTPGQIDGRDIGHPTSCVNKGIFAGMVGTWELPQKFC